MKKEKMTQPPIKIQLMGLYGVFANEKFIFSEPK